MFYTQQNAALLLATFLSALTTPAFLVTAYVINANSLTDAASQQQQQQSPASSLASKVIFQSPSVENIFKEYIVSSKPLNIRKYSNRPKTKKTKKDSRIYYIPIPPLPYRFLPGIGYDYQPMKIKPLLVEPEVTMTTENYSGYKIPNPYKQYQQHLQNSYYQAMPPRGYPASTTEAPTPPPVTKPPVVAESKIYRVDRNDYYFNGRPFRLQVAHAGPKYNLTPQNLKSSFYFNKNIIY